jgi:hypothetical protein
MILGGISGRLCSNAGTIVCGMAVPVSSVMVSISCVRTGTPALELAATMYNSSRKFTNHNSLPGVVFFLLWSLQ